ncbi:hypothetical protein Leryth_025017 [Lithospermum erythrorhizon]|nr:hypothetical protein Leryth_025017 [Lithospermum erythrorhizon]
MKTNTNQTQHRNWIEFNIKIKFFSTIKGQIHQQTIIAFNIQIKID